MAETLLCLLGVKGEIMEKKLGIFSNIIRAKLGILGFSSIFLSPLPPPVLENFYQNIFCQCGVVFGAGWVSPINHKNLQ